MKITKRQLKKIIREEKTKLLNEGTNFTVDIFSSDDLYDLLVDAVEDHLQSSPSGKFGGLTRTEADMLRKKMNTAVNNIIEDYGQ